MRPITTLSLFLTVVTTTLAAQADPPRAPPVQTPCHTFIMNLEGRYEQELQPSVHQVVALLMEEIAHTQSQFQGALALISGTRHRVELQSIQERFRERNRILDGIRRGDFPEYPQDCRVLRVQMQRRNEFDSCYSTSGEPVPGCTAAQQAIAIGRRVRLEACDLVIRNKIYRFFQEEFLPRSRELQSNDDDDPDWTLAGWTLEDITSATLEELNVRGDYLSWLVREREIRAFTSPLQFARLRFFSGACPNHSHPDRSIRSSLRMNGHLRCNDRQSGRPILDRSEIRSDRSSNDDLQFDIPFDDRYVTRRDINKITVFLDRSPSFGIRLLEISAYLQDPHVFGTVPAPRFSIGRWSDRGENGEISYANMDSTDLEYIVRSTYIREALFARNAGGCVQFVK